MKYISGVLLVMVIVIGTEKTEAQLIGSCEGCEAVLEYGDRTLSSVDTLPEFDSPGQKIRVSGTIYEADGVTPAEGVILYVYQTNEEGVYPTRGDEEGWAGRHGYIRGWVKTDEQGSYTFFTQKPGSYGSSAAHIHPIILEPDGRYYWLGSYFFEGDPNLSDRQKNPSTPRGGSNGVLDLQEESGIWVATRDITLGKNVRGYR